MPATTNEQMEGRINALRELLLVLARRRPQDEREALARELRSLAGHQNHQEDPGAVPNEAFAMEVARTRELETLLRDIEADPAG